MDEQIAGMKEAVDEGLLRGGLVPSRGMSGGLTSEAQIALAS